MRIRKLSLAATAGALASMGLATPAHAAANLACGQTITSSVTLSADIGPCPGDGLIVAANGIALNLGGHTVRGVGNRSADQVGVRLENVSGATVANGTVMAFNAGVTLENSTGSTVANIRALNNTSTGATNHGDGIIADGSSNNQIIGNEVAGNGPLSGVTMVDGSDNNVVKGNNIHDNTLVRAEPSQVAPDQEDHGVRFDTGSSGNIIDSNKIIGNGGSGVQAPGFEHVNLVIKNNLIQGNGQFGIVSPGQNYTLSGNTVANNGFDQFRVPGAGAGAFDGILLFGNFGGGPGVVDTNLVRGNARDGISLIFPGFTFNGNYTPPLVYQIRGNTAVNNVRNGIHMDCDFVANAFPQHVCLTSSPPHEGQHIIGNTASGNGGVNAGRTAWDLLDENPNCDSNQWLDNRGGTANPPCTLTKSQ